MGKCLGRRRAGGAVRPL